MSLILAAIMIANLLSPVGQLKVNAAEEHEHDYYWYHTDTMGEDGYDLKCSVCEEDFGRGYKMEDEYYMYDTAYTHNVYTEDGEIIYNENCQIARWSVDEDYHSGICKCHVILVDETEHNYDLTDTCIECGYVKDSVESGTIDSEIVFVNEASTVSYSGEPIGLDEEDVNVLVGEGAVSFKYYSDEACTERIEVPVEPGKYYVKATISADGDYTYAMTEDTHILTIRPRKVASATVANMKSSIKLTWNGRPEADGYNIYRRFKGESSSDYELVGYVTAEETLSFTDTNITQGKGYVYTIRAYAYAADGTEIEGLMMTNAKKIVRTKVTSITNQNGSVKVKWTKISKADGYKVYRKSSGDDGYKLIKTIKDSSVNYYTDKAEKAIKNGKASYYYVKPYFEEEDGFVRTTDKKTNYYMSRLTINSLTAGNKAFTVKWSKNSKATGYQIRYSRFSSFESYNTVKVTDKDTLSKKISDLTKNKKYYVKVRAYKTYNGVMYPSAWSAVKNVKTKDSSGGSTSDDSTQGTTTSNEVWISETGSKYHKINDCGSMNPDKAHKVTKSTAESMGLEACDKCF